MRHDNKQLGMAMACCIAMASCAAMEVEAFAPQVLFK